MRWNTPSVRVNTFVFFFSVVVLLFPLSAVVAAEGGKTSHSPPGAAILDEVSSDVILAERPELVTFGLDAADYNRIGKEIAESIFNNLRITNRESPPVLILGPVDVEDSLYPLDERTLQEKVSASLQRASIFQVTFATDAMPEANAQIALQRVLEFNFDKNERGESDELKMLRSLADIDYLLFGRLSSNEAEVDGVLEVTYTFNWKLGNARTGLLEWAEDIEITKRGPQPEPPLWLTFPKSDTARYYYQTASAAAANPTDAVEAAEELAIREMTDRLNAVLLPEQDVVVPVPVSAFEAQKKVVETALISRAGGLTAWVVLRVPTTLTQPYVERRKKALEDWEEFYADYLSFKSVPQANRRYHITEFRSAVKQFLQTYPLAQKSDLFSEQAIFLLAEVERDLGNKFAMQKLYQRVVDHSPWPDWVSRAKGRINTISVTEEDEVAFNLRRELEGRRIVVMTFLTDRTSGKSVIIPKASTELKVFFEKQDAIPVIYQAAEDEDMTRYLDTQSYESSKDRIFLFWVHGTYAATPDERARGGRRLSFSGELRYGFYHQGKSSFSKSTPLHVSETIFGKSMLQGMIAIKALKAWKKDYSDYLQNNPSLQ